MMTQAKWNSMSAAERAAARDLSSLSPALVGLEGWRVEVVTLYHEVRRFIVGMSTGWVPCHLEVKTRRSMGGMPADTDFISVKKLYKVR